MDAILVLFAPAAFIKRRLATSASLDRALLPLGITTGLLAWGMIRVGDRVVLELEPWAVTIFAITYSMTVVGASLGVFVSWLAITGASHLLSLEFGGRPERFTRLAELTAWATMPIALYSGVIVISAGWLPAIRLDAETTSVLNILRTGRYAAEIWSLALIVGHVSGVYRISWWKALWIVAVPACVQVLTLRLLTALTW